MLMFLLCVMLTLIALSESSFYFCLNGPQRLNLSECPSGVVMLKPVESRCAGLIREKGERSLITTLKSSLCESPSEIVQFSPQNSSVERDIAFQTLTTEPSLVMAYGIHYEGMEGPLGKCLVDCLVDWIDPRAAIEDDPPYQYGIGPPTAEIIAEQNKFSQDLFMYMSIDFDSESDGNSNGDMRILDVLHETLEVLAKQCSPFVPSELVDAVYGAHKFLVLHAGTADVNDLGIREHAIITNALQKCRDNPSKLFIVADKCGNHENSIIKEINGVKPKLEARSYRWGLFDVAIEAAWSAIDFVHGYCYEQFMNDLTYQHLLIKSLEALFSRKILDRWMYPTKLKQDQYWNNMLGVDNINLTMRNIDACVVAGRRFSNYKDRLGRPFEKQPGTYQKGSASLPPTASLAQKGFNGNLNEYWDGYSSFGGLKGALQGFGSCAVSDEDFGEGIRLANGYCAGEGGEGEQAVDENEEGQGGPENSVDDY